MALRDSDSESKSESESEWVSEKEGEYCVREVMIGFTKWTT